MNTLTVSLTVLLVISFITIIYKLVKLLIDWRQLNYLKNYSKINIINFIWLISVFSSTSCFFLDHIHHRTIYNFNFMGATSIFLLFSFISITCFIISRFNPKFKKYMFEKSEYTDYENMKLDNIHEEIEAGEKLKQEICDTYEKLFEAIRSLETSKIKAVSKIKKLRIAKQIEDLYKERGSLNKTLDECNKKLSILHYSRLEYKGEKEQKEDKKKAEYIHFLKTLNVQKLDEVTGGAVLKTTDDILNEAKAQG